MPVSRRRSFPLFRHLLIQLILRLPEHVYVALDFMLHGMRLMSSLTAEPKGSIILIDSDLPISH